MLHREVLDAALQEVVVQAPILRVTELGEYHGRQLLRGRTIPREGTPGGVGLDAERVEPVTI